MCTVHLKKVKEEERAEDSTGPDYPPVEVFAENPIDIFCRDLELIFSASVL
jgi:hypothetical protein